MASLGQISNFMVGAMDNDLLVRMIDEDIPTFAMQSNMTTSDFGCGLFFRDFLTQPMGIQHSYLQFASDHTNYVNDDHHIWWFT